MQLSFLSPHLSVTALDPVEIPDLCVVTGVNGAGKSHLLQAIVNGNVRAEGVRKEEIVLFSGETFRLENQGPVSATAAIQERHNGWEFLKNPNQNPDIFRTLESYRNALGQAIERIKIKAQQSNKPIWQLELVDGLSEEYFQLLVKYRFNVYDHLFHHPQLRNNHHAQSILKLAKKIDVFVDELSKERFYSLYEPKQLKESFLPSQLSMVFSDYYSKLEENEYFAFKSHQGGQHAVLSDEQFVSQNGPRPWDVINQILSRIGTIPYRITSPEGLNRFEPFQAELVHQYNKGIRPNFNDLSSGEKVLIALVVSVYKASSDRNFPKLLLLDEIDASLHPSMMQSMLQVIGDTFLSNGVSTILITHSPTTVAICPEGSLFVMNPSGSKRLEHRSRAEALDILTEGFVTLTKGLSVLDEVARTKVSIVTEGHNVSLIERALLLNGIDSVAVVSGIEDRSGSQQLKLSINS